MAANVETIDIYNNKIPKNILLNIHCLAPSSSLFANIKYQIYRGNVIMNRIAS
eukprot:TRINITY_DN12914_c0_g1_i1.p3 TRINITY_DN12914_c0_g1~~TRINITY_DN12914_c0_g1_i1.p3  ORF type:complete len:53 (-),score=1.74 TRINITY_DN12914_c0_g1_i1:32-190(-)